MNGISSISSSLYLGANAMAVHSTGMQVETHNIANVNTASFQPQRALLATGPNGIGVELDTVTRETMPTWEREYAGVDDSMANIMPPEFLHPSGTELAREFPRMINTQRSFQANSATVRTADEMLGSLLNITA